MSVDRDRILEQALKHELRGDNAATPHLDAETLAAWQDDALNAAQMADIELHVSTCARCQSMLAAFARGTSSTLGTLGTPGTVGTPGTAGTPSTPGTFSWWRWWLAEDTVHDPGAAQDRRSRHAVCRDLQDGALR